VSLLVAAVVAGRVRASHLLKVALIGAVAVGAVLVLTVVAVVAVAVPAVVVTVVLVVAVAVLQRPVVPVVDAVQQVVAEALLVAQTHALVVPAAVLASTSLAIRL
jgi:hypothetical protein